MNHYACARVRRSAERLRSRRRSAGVAVAAVRQGGGPRRPSPNDGSTAHERRAGELQEQAAALEEEVVALRRRLQDAPKRVRTLEERLLETKGQLAQAVSQNEKLTYTLREAREHIAALREEVDKLTQPPSAYGTVLGRNDDGTVDVFSGGRKMRVAVHPDARATRPRSGATRSCSTSRSTSCWPAAGELTGEVVTLKEVLDDGSRALDRRPGRRGAGVRARRRPARTRSSAPATPC